MSILQKIGETIRHQRELKNFSLKDTASKAGIQVRQLDLIEKGEWNATLSTLEKISEVLELQVFIK